MKPLPVRPVPDRPATDAAMAGPQAEGSHRPTAAAPAFLQAWELPSQWSGRDDFVLLALGFGAGTHVHDLHVIGSRQVCGWVLLEGGGGSC